MAFVIVFNFASGSAPDPPPDVATAVFLDAFRPEARCLDGSPYAFYLRPSSSSSSASKWVFHMEGGGWCDSTASCLARSAKSLGSSDPAKTNFSNTSSFADVACDNKGW